MSNLKGAKALNRKEQKEVFGGAPSPLDLQMNDLNRDGRIDIGDNTPPCATSAMCVCEATGGS